MRVVLDTNVLVSGLLTPFGPSGELIRMISAGVLTLRYDSRILSEYHEVLHRTKFQFDKANLDIRLAYVKHSGRLVPADPLGKRLPDPDESLFLKLRFQDGRNA